MSGDKVLITGGVGFIGSHIVEYLLSNTDLDIVILDRLDISGTPSRLTSIKNWEKYRSRVEFVWWDLKAPINEITARYIGLCKFILHTAASSHVDRSIKDPLGFVMDNIVGTVNLLDFARKMDCLEKLIYISTDEVMGSALNNRSYLETDAGFPENPYSGAKFSAEAMCCAYACSFWLPLLIVRLTNVMGERQHPEKFVPLVIAKVLRGETIYIHADKTETVPGSRFYIYAGDVAEALYFLLSHKVALLTKEGRQNGIYNISGNEEINNLEIAELISGVMKQPLHYKLVNFHENRPNHDLRYALDSSKLKALGWSPKIQITSVIPRVVEWYLSNREWLLV